MKDQITPWNLSVRNSVERGDFGESSDKFEAHHENSRLFEFDMVQVTPYDQPRNLLVGGVYANEENSVAGFSHYQFDGAGSGNTQKYRGS